jgi:hypothetical protein
LSNVTSLLNEKKYNFNNLHFNEKKENFIYNVISKDMDRSFRRPSKILNKGFIIEGYIKEENEERMSKINEKINSMIKSHDNFTNNS